MAHISLEHYLTPGWADALHGAQSAQWPVKQFAGPGDAMKPDTDDELLDDDEDEDDDEFDDDDDEDVTDDEVEETDEETGR